MEVFILAICLLMMAVGLLGVLIPGLPGVVLIFAASLVYAYFTHFKEISWAWIAVFALLTLIAVFADYLASLLGAKKFGVSKYGIIGAVAGGLIGLLIGSFAGCIIGQFAGVLIVEMHFGKKMKPALRAGAGVFVGYILGTMVQLLIATLIISIFLLKIFL